jgi:L-ascorbate metabolism protein UlaG (beta-lactamase superfamily)
MEIYPLGHASYKLRGKNAVIVTDPYDSGLVGLKFPKVEANVVTVSHQHEDHNNISGVSGSPFIISGPGEYDIHGVRILGISTFHDEAGGSKRGKNTIYQIMMDNLVLIHCGDLGHKLTTEQIEEVGNPDILFIPIGGYFTIDSHIASELVMMLEPKIVIPMHYLRKGMNQEQFGQISPVAAFLKEMGKERVIPQPKLTISKDKLPQETEIVLLE